jgi:hypothetical protein
MISYVTEAAAHFEQTYDLPVTLMWVDTAVAAALGEKHPRFGRPQSAAAVGAAKSLTCADDSPP